MAAWIPIALAAGVVGLLYSTRSKAALAPNGAPSPVQPDILAGLKAGDSVTVPVSYIYPRGLPIDISKYRPGGFGPNDQIDSVIISLRDTTTYPGGDVKGRLNGFNWATRNAQGQYVVTGGVADISEEIYTPFFSRGAITNVVSLPTAPRPNM